MSSKQKKQHAETPAPTRRRRSLVGPIIGFALGFAAATALWRFGPLALPDVAPPPVAAATIPGLPPARFVPTTGRPSRGPMDAPITIVEFTDYECPYCRRHFRETLPQIQANYGDRIRYVVKNFPLSSIHPQALKAAEAAECAGDQNMFWEYHDRLFNESPDLSVEDLKSYAEDMDMDSQAFASCLDSGSKRSTVDADFRDAVSLGLRGTPGFFVNGRALYGAQPYRMFEAVFQAVAPSE